MFFTVTRVGGTTALRVAAAAVAHITTMTDGAVLHLTSGEQLRVNEAADDVERQICLALIPELIACEAVAAEPMVTLRDIDELLRQRFAEHSFATPLPQATAIDEGQEDKALDVAERAGLIDGVQAMEQRVERVARRNRGRRA